MRQGTNGTTGGQRREPPTIDITPDGYRVHQHGDRQDGDRQHGNRGDDRHHAGGRPVRRPSMLGGLLTIAVVGLVLVGAFALGILTFLIAIPVAVGAVIAALIAGFFLRHRLRNAMTAAQAAAATGSGAGRGPGGGNAPGGPGSGRTG